MNRIPTSQSSGRSLAGASCKARDCEHKTTSRCSLDDPPPNQPREYARKPHTEDCKKDEKKLHASTTFSAASRSRSVIAFSPRRVFSRTPDNVGRCGVRFAC